MYIIEWNNTKNGCAKWLNTYAAIYTEVVVIYPANQKKWPL